MSSPRAWVDVKLSDLGEVNRGRSRHRPRYAPHLYGGPHPFIQTGDIKASGGRITTYQQTYSKAGLAQSRLWPAQTMCITIAATIAETAILTFPACFPDSVVGFISDPKKCDVYFVEYVFRNLRSQIQHVAAGSGSVQDNINIEFLENLRFRIPRDVEEQRRIALKLRLLDDKIELNRKMSHTLEALAQAIFKSWFVDFDPVVAKAAGRKPIGMNAQTAALFPDSFQDSPLGPIPKGWSVGTVGDIVTISRGGVLPTDSPNEVFAHFSIPAYDDGALPRMDAGRTIQSLKYLVPNTAVLLSKLNPATPRVWLPATSGEARCICSTEFMPAVAKDRVPRLFVYGLFSSEQFSDDFASLVTGTSNSHQRVKPDDLMRMPIVQPSAGCLKAFAEAVGDILVRKAATIQQSHTLGSLRDSALPLLMEAPDA